MNDRERIDAMLPVVEAAVRWMKLTRQVAGARGVFTERAAVDAAYQAAQDLETQTIGYIIKTEGGW